MLLKIDGFPPEVEKEVNHIVEELWNVIGCVSRVNEEFTMTGIDIATDVLLLKKRDIFLPATTKIGVFKIDTAKQIMTLMYFPHVRDKADVFAN